MDAKHWNGDDEREFGPDREDGSCEVCGVPVGEDCLPGCSCPQCPIGREGEAA